MHDVEVGLLWAHDGYGSVEVGLLWAHDGYGSGNMCQLPLSEGDESTKVVTHILCVSYLQLKVTNQQK